MLIRDHWRDVLRVIFCAFIAAVSTVYGTLAIAYGKNIGNMDESITLWLVVAGNVGALFTQPFFGKLADRIGRKPVFIYGALSAAAFMPFYLLSMEPATPCCTSRSRCWSSPALRRGQRRLALLLRARCSPPRCASPAWPSAPSSAS